MGFCRRSRSCCQRRSMASTDSALAVDGYFGRHSTLVLQAFLAGGGFLDKAALGWDHWDDGRFGPKTKTALRAFLQANGYEVGESGGWCGWPRQSVKALQSWTKDQGAEPGPIDGRWGRRTSAALQATLNALRAKDLRVTVADTVVDAMPLKEASAVAAAFSAALPPMKDSMQEPLVAAGVPLLVGVPPPKAASAA